MRKITKRGLKTKLDKVLSEQVRSQGFCSKCRKDDYSKLHCCHIFSRKLMSVRFDRDNLVCLCSSCHAEFHDRPILFQEFIKEYLGKERYSQLIMKSTMIKKWTIFELQELYDRLKEAKC